MTQNTFAQKKQDNQEVYTLKLPVYSNNSSSKCDLTKTVFGWHPYWMNGKESRYQWNLLSDLCYFSYEVNPRTGESLTDNGFQKSNAVTTALQKGKKVHLCVTLFKEHASFFESYEAQTKLIVNLVNALGKRKAHGINIDFEGVPATQRTNFTNFLSALGDSLHLANPMYELSLCTFAVDWGNVFNETALNDKVDFFTLMGYDYHYSGSRQAGPVDPLFSFKDGYDYSISRSVSYYLKAGIPASKLVLGIPYYGREWETKSQELGALTTGHASSSKSFKVVLNNENGNYSTPHIDPRSRSTYYSYQKNGKWYQCWISDVEQIKERYDFVRRRNLKGVGLWTLGNDDGMTQLWDAIEEKLTYCTEWQQNDTLYDEGGPAGNYYNNERISYTVAPRNAAAIHVRFLEMDTEHGFDSLWLYDGASANAPLIGAYSGNILPSDIVAQSGMLTVNFQTDGTNRAPGWAFEYTTIPRDEVVSANASKPILNNLLQQSFPGANLDVNAQQSAWKMPTGNWEVHNKTLVQTDDGASSAIACVAFPLVGSDSYTFHWKSRIDGTIGNRRAGFHFMCDNLKAPNMGNSYFISYRVDFDLVQIYKVVDNHFDLVASYDVDLSANTYYDTKIAYSLSVGKMEIYINNMHVGTWVDQFPLRDSQGISFRTANARFQIEEIGVYDSGDNVAFLLNKFDFPLLGFKK